MGHVTDQTPPSALTRRHIQHLSDGRAHHIRVGHVRQRYEEDPVREVRNQLFGDGDRQPSLPGPTRPGERYQPDLGRPEQRCQLGYLTVTSDQRGPRDREAGCGADRLQRREVGSQAVDRELVQVLRPRDVLQLVASEIQQPDAVRQPCTSQICGHGRQHDLPAVSGRCDPGRAVDIHPDITAVVHLRGPSVDSDADADALTSRPRIDIQLPLGLSGSADRRLGGGEHDEEAVPFRPQFCPSMCRPGLAQHVALPVQRLGVDRP
jgi:hypothetical protein